MLFSILLAVVSRASDGNTAIILLLLLDKLATAVAGVVCLQIQPQSHLFEGNALLVKGTKVCNEL